MDCKNNVEMKTFYFLRIKYVVWVMAAIDRQSEEQRHISNHRGKSQNKDSDCVKNSWDSLKCKSWKHKRKCIG